jgi:hypothetical protein
MAIRVTPVATMGYFTISPPGRGNVRIPSTRLRVPGGIEITVEPDGEGALYTPVPLHLATVLFDETSGGLPTRFGRGVPEGVALPGDWRYRVVKLTLLSDQGVGPTDLVKIRLPGLLQRALRPYVSVIADDEGGLTLGSQDPDERAVLAYVIAQLVGDNPTQSVATELGVSANAAAQRVWRLRQAGRLPAVPKKPVAKKPKKAVPKKGTASWPDDPSRSASSRAAGGKPARQG